MHFILKEKLHEEEKGVGDRERLQRKGKKERITRRASRRQRC